MCIFEMFNNKSVLASVEYSKAVPSEYHRINILLTHWACLLAISAWMAGIP